MAFPPHQPISVASYTFRPCTVDLKFVNVAYGVKLKGEKREILENVSGQFEHGKIHCIMGPSGAGKSSLLNVLAGFNRIAEGSVVVNGCSLPANKCGQMMSSISSYILQDDFLIPELTVRETLEFAACVKTPPDIEVETRRQLLNDLLAKMGLAEVADRSIARLSGGQRKRVAVMVELVNYPPVLLLDEPTTGLDSTSCYRLVELLKAVASAGCNVIATIHQPNSRIFRMFDSLFVLAAGGRLAYDGPPLALAATLGRIGVACPSTENPADLLFQPGNIAKLAEKWSLTLCKLAAKDSDGTAITEAEFDPHLVKFRLANFDGDDFAIKLESQQRQLEAATKKKAQGVEGLRCLQAGELMEYCSHRRATALTTFVALQKRCFVQAFRDIVFFAGRFIAFALVSILVGMTFQFVARDAGTLMINIACIFIITVLPLMGNALVTIVTFPNHFNVLLRENINSWYSTSYFFLTRAVVDNAIGIATACIFPTVVWAWSGQLQWPGIGIPVTMLIMCLHAMTGHHLAYIMAMSGDENSLPYLPFAIVMLHSLFSGFMIPINAMPVWIKWVQYVYFGQFSYRATMRAAYGQLLPATDVHGGPIQIPCSFALNPMCAIKTGDQVLEFIKIYPNEGHTIWTDIASIAAFLVFFFVSGWHLLILKMRSSKRAITRT